MHLVGFIIRIYHDARSPERQIRLCVCPSSGNDCASTGHILMKLNIVGIFPKTVEEIQFSLKSDKNNGYFTSIPVNIFYYISLSYCLLFIVYFHTKASGKIKTHIMFNNLFFERRVVY